MMINLPTIASIRAVLDQPIAQDLKELMEDRLSDALHCGLQDHIHILVVEARDTEAQITSVLGFSPLGPNGYEPEWLERHGRWWELLHCVGAGGFAYIVLVEDSGRSFLAERCEILSKGQAQIAPRIANKALSR